MICTGDETFITIHRTKKNRTASRAKLIFISTKIKKNQSAYHKKFTQMHAICAIGCFMFKLKHPKCASFKILNHVR